METELKIDQKDLLRILCDEENWPSYGLDPAKGLFLMGNTGVGKSWSLEAYLKETKKNRGRLINPEIIMMGVGSEGSNYFHRFITDHLFWDDFAMEPVSQMYMGTTFFPAASIVQVRESKFPALKSHFTTNKLPEDISERYGDRVLSRLRLMCNFIIVTGKDLRK